MTELLDRAIRSVKSLPADKQDEIADFILSWSSSSDEPEEIPAEHLEAVKEGLDQLNRGEFYSESQLRELLKSFS